MIKLIIKVLKRYAWFRRLNAKIVYELLASRIPGSKWQFMNYGYLPLETGYNPSVKIEPASQRNSLLMYHYLAIQTAIEGRRLLEVGSGRGGGAGYIAGTFKPALYIGLDIAKNAVALASRLHVLPNLKFIRGSAEAIPLPDDSIDVVLNVESCHAYGSVSQFLSEVKRVLKPGGYLILADFRSENKITVLQHDLRNAGLDMLKEENISDNVIRSIEEEDSAKVALIDSLVPARWRALFSEFAGVVGSRFYQTLKDGSRHYYRFVLRKPMV